jgi:hypothetical protein
MSSSHEWFWVQAARLFEMASEARKNDESELADLLTEGARQCLERLAEREVLEANLVDQSARLH